MDRHAWGSLTAKFSWYGRLGRRGFASAAFAIYLAFFPVDLAGDLAWLALHPEQVDETLPASLGAYMPAQDLAGPILAAALILVVLLALAMLSISIRRFHDMSLSGWGVVVAVVVIAFLPKIAVPSPFGSVWQWVWFAALSALPGDAEANVFGPAPHVVPGADTT